MMCSESPETKAGMNPQEGAKSQRTTGPIPKPVLLKKRAELLHLLMQLKDEKREVGLDWLQDQVDLGKDKIKHLLDNIYDANPRLFIWASNSTIDLGSQSYYTERENTNARLKNAIARAVIDQVPPGATLVCSSGTTVTTCIREFGKARRQLFVVTNNVGVLENSGALSSSLVIKFVGGQYSVGSHSCVGDETVQSFRETNCRIAVISVSGVNQDGDLFVYHPEESPIHSVIAALPSVKRLIIVADATKLTGPDRWAFACLPDLFEQDHSRQILLITNSSDTKGLHKDEKKKAAEVQAALEDKLKDRVKIIKSE